MYAYGVFIDVTTSGIIGSVNYVYLINVLVSGLVLLKVAGSICDIVAMYGLGTRSLVYSNHMLEPASFEREAAKYAIQGAMAVNAFRAADTKRSGDGLDIEEIYESPRRGVPQRRRNVCRRKGIGRFRRGQVQIASSHA